MSIFDVFQIRLIKEINFYDDDNAIYKTYEVGEVYEAYQTIIGEFYTLWATDECIHWDEAVKL